MSTNANLDDDFDNNEDLDLPEPARKRLRTLERENKDLRNLKEENDRYKLKEDLRKSNMDFSDIQLKALLASHEGESTPEELRKTAEVLGFVEPLAATDANDEAAHGAIDSARSGANATGGHLESYEEEVAGAKNMAELQAIAAKHGKAQLERQG